MSRTKKVIHSTNSTVNPNALSSNILSCDPFSYSTSLSMQHSIFAVNPINKTTYGNEIWVLDTGAIDHIVHSITLFTKITSSTSTFVQLPNDEKAIVTHMGTIQVISTLVLENVLCVPSFTFNLISVSNLTKSLSCCVVFLSSCMKNNWSG